MTSFTARLLYTAKEPRVSLSLVSDKVRVYKGGFVEWNVHIGCLLELARLPGVKTLLTRNNWFPMRYSRGPVF